MALQAPLSQTVKDQWEMCEQEPRFNGDIWPIICDIPMTGKRTTSDPELSLAPLSKGLFFIIKFELWRRRGCFRLLSTWSLISTVLTLEFMKRRRFKTTPALLHRVTDPLSVSPPVRPSVFNVHPLICLVSLSVELLAGPVAHREQDVL